MKLFLVYFFVLMNQAFAIEPEYTLVCVFDGNQQVTQVQNSKEPNKINLSFSFVKGTKPARLGVDPGTCAWFDRPMYENEPATAIHVTLNQFYWKDLVYKGVPNLVYTPIWATWATESRTPGHMMWFRVYRTGPDHNSSYPYFMITRW